MWRRVTVDWVRCVNWVSCMCGLMRFCWYRDNSRHHRSEQGIYIHLNPHQPTTPSIRGLLPTRFCMNERMNGWIPNQPIPSEGLIHLL